MRWRQVLSYMKGRYVDPQYAFRDRLYFLFGTAGLLSAGAAFVAAVCSGLPAAAAIASLGSFFVMLLLMAVSFFTKDVSANRVFCCVFLNFVMFPVLFWVTGGAGCGMVFYFILALCVAALILTGRLRIILLAAALIFDTVTLDLGYRHPEWATALTYEQRQSDVVSSFAIVSVFVIAVIIIMSQEYQREHDKVLASAAQLRLQAITDNLTTLFNQRYLISELKELTAGCTASGRTACLLLLDIDDFKKVNDTYGHLRGNQVLCQFAALMKARAEARSFVAARYGGEEFIVVLPDCPAEDAFRFADDLRAELCADPILHKLIHGAFSVSGGVAQYEPGWTPDEWIRQADDKMYAAKQRGKNCIVA